VLAADCVCEVDERTLLSQYRSNYNWYQFEIKMKHDKYSATNKSITIQLIVIAIEKGRAVKKEIQVSCCARNNGQEDIHSYNGR
jgi:hypothetical protein